MTRALDKDVAEVRARLVAAAKGNVPGTHRSAAQFRHDIKQWQTWQRYGDKLPGLPRSIRRALALAKSAPCAKKQISKNKFHEAGHNPTPLCIKVAQNELFLDSLGAERGRCMAIACAIIGRYRLAEDCVSTCMVSALEQLAEGKVAFASQEKFCAWLHTIMRFAARRVARTATYLHGDFLPDRHILPSLGRKCESPEVDEQADPHDYEELAYPDDDARVVGESKLLPTADDQLNKMTFQV